LSAFIKSIFNRLSRCSFTRVPAGIYVFLYHDVVDCLSDSLMNQKVGTDCHTFATHLDYYKKQFHMIKLSDAVKLFASGGTISENYGVITFDDAYKSVIENAVPLLNERDIPATIFVCHNPAVGLKGLWRQRLALLLDPRKKETLDLFNEKMKTKHASFEDLFNWCKENYSIELEKLIDEIWNDKNMGKKDLSLYATYKDLNSLDDSTYEFGSHTISHPVLSRISLSEARHEIVIGHHLVEKGLQKRVKFFAYPFGCVHHWNRECEGYISELSDVYAVGATGGVNRQLSPLHIRRIGFTNHSVDDMLKVLITEGKRIS
jgi:peptidoglycan/xylan/chitin deacetylase (PgdA/CDA1 family)